MPMPASNPCVCDLVENDIAYLLFVVDAHERLRQANDLVAILRHPCAFARTIEHQPPLLEPMGIHEAASELVYVQKIHASSVEVMPIGLDPSAQSLSPISDTLRRTVNSCGRDLHERLLWRKLADFRASSPGLSRLARTQSGRLDA